MMGFGWQELLIVLVIVMIIFGAGKLHAGRATRSAWASKSSRRRRTGQRDRC